jgi:diguanylate cyclase (GGDEF)-like protein
MDKIWDFFENMNELVYASDVNSHDIVYLNRKARELYKIQSVEKLNGKKCYEVLQGSSSPCAICNNRKLKSGYFEEWKYYNPIHKKTFALKDTLIEDKKTGKYYRIELAIDITVQEEQKEILKEYMDTEAMINEGLRISMSSSDPNESIEILLEYLGKALTSDRIYIFEQTGENRFDNTYEWCAEGVTAEKCNLQNVPSKDLNLWLERFHLNENVIVKNLEEIKESDPVVYDYLYPQDIRSVVVSPLIFNNKIIGFYGVDNPPEKLVENISTMFLILGHFIVSMLRRRDLVQRLENFSFYDQLTGCGNRHGMNEYIANMNVQESIGLLYGDITGLKRVNDTLGHQEGDRLLVRASECLKRVFSEYSVFRIGGDEFLVLCSGITKEELFKRAEELKKDTKEHSVIMATGCAWKPDGEGNIEKLLKKADKRMYRAKREYYANILKES